LDGIGITELRVGVRTGDTPAAERRAMIKSPPHILITTPESLYILLSSASGALLLRTARAVIIDELHALIGSKRGAHLMFSIARLDRLCPAVLQRVGLSATIEPLDIAAQYLSPGGASIVAPKMDKAVQIMITSPMPESGILPEGTIWPELARAVFSYCEGARCVIAFVESRMNAEKLAYHVNLVAGEGFALTHHGSVSKERRAQAEQALREGRLRLLCATSSMELGIDVGEIDLVLQVGCPATISGTMQRLGRAGHNPGRVSAMRMFPRTASEGLYCGLTARVARDRGLERSRPPEGCLDVLAQHLVSMAGSGAYTVDEALAVARRAYPFRNVTAEQADGVLRMLAGDYEHGRDIPARPRVLYDRIHGNVRGDAYSRLLALSAGGTIPDRGLFAVKTESGVKLGEVDEEFVFEARIGDRFLLGAFAWRIVEIGRDAVVVVQTGTEGVPPPFWKGDGAGRPIETGLAFGAILRGLGALAAEEADGEAAAAPDSLNGALRELGLDRAAASGARSLILRQLEATSALPDDRTMIVEHFQDEAGEDQLVVHSVFGRRVNAPLAELARETARRISGADVGLFVDDDGFLMFPLGGQPLPEGLLYAIDPDAARGLLVALLPATPLFGMAFRYNAARALMMGMRSRGRQPLWVQRLRGAKLLDELVRIEGHPLVAETRRECLEDYWDLQGLGDVLAGVRSGSIRVRELVCAAPSPMSLPLRRQVEATMMYEYSPTARGVTAAAEAALTAAASEGRALPPGQEQLDHASRRARVPENPDQLHTLLMTEGDQLAGEVDVPVGWFEGLARQGRARYIEPGLWIAAEHAREYAAALPSADVPIDAPVDGAVDVPIDGAIDSVIGETVGGAIGGAVAADVAAAEAAEAGVVGRAADVGEAAGAGDGFLEARRHIVRRALRYHGGHAAEQVADRYCFSDAEAEAVLAELRAHGEAVFDGGVYYHAELYERARRETVRARRARIQTQPRERYAALLVSRAESYGAGTPAERAETALRALCGQAFSPALWESVLLPWRVGGYRPELLDAILARGGLFWRIDASGALAFYPYDEMDWEAGDTGATDKAAPARGGPAAAVSVSAPAVSGALTQDSEDLNCDERAILDALTRRGALFTQGLTAPLGGRSPYEPLLGLVEKGLVRSDSFVPVRQLAEREKVRKATVRQRAHVRQLMLTSGRWELARGLAQLTMERQIERAFDRALLLCRETAPELLWARALEVLRVWEYTGLVRRGYYIEGLSGAQFVRERDFPRVTAALAQTQPTGETLWLPAPDPAQQWGKALAHLPGRAFLNVPGTVVGLRAGLPIAVFERQGQTLRVFADARPDSPPAGRVAAPPDAALPDDVPAALPDDAPDVLPDALPEALRAFARLYAQRRVYPARGSLTLKQYPPGAGEALRAAGFSRHMQDYVLYRQK
ncbi:MAG: DEAD/DEAH box helicase, partial [Clostridiales bacterium]|nr:DEAD/DEAH box helicase [Clostridiales bacterium]